MRLAGRVVVVTRGESAISRGIAKRFAEEGARVVAFDEAGSLAGAPGIETVRVDDCTIDALEMAITDIAARHGGIDILVNGCLEPDRFLALSDANQAAFESAFRRDFHPVHAAMRAVHPHMRVRGGGIILNLLWPYGDTIWRGLAASQAAAEAILALTRTAAEEWGRDGVLVNALIPAAESAMLTAARAGDPAVDRLVSGLPLGRLGDPAADIGGAALLLATAAGRFLTGHVVYADGGQHLAPSPFEAVVPSVEALQTQ